MSKLDGLSPKFRARAEAALDRMNADAELKALGVARVVVVEGLRPLATQMAYYSRGRMKTADVQAMFQAAGLWRLSDTEAQTPVTWTLKSRHLDGLAVDLAPSRDGESIWWTAPAPVWERMGIIGQSFGLEWGGTWEHKNRDCPHFQSREDV